MKAAKKSILSAAKKRFEEIKNSTLFSRLPALLILSGIVNGILPRVACVDESPSLTLAIPLFAVVLIFLLLPRKKCVIFLVSTVAGICASLFVAWLPADNFERILGQRDRNAEVTVRIIDSSCCGKNIPWMDNPSLIQAEVLTVKLSGDEQEHNVSGQTMLRLPKDAPLLFYGDVLRLSGVFIIPDSTAYCRKITVSTSDGKTTDVYNGLKPVSGNFDFNDYLKARGFSRIFNCREITGSEKTTTGIYTRIMELRNFLLKQADENIASQTNRRILATLLFGCRQGVDSQLKNAYIKSGTIHIFTVSGLHVGILALALFWLLRWVPFRLRHAIIPFLILAYVAATGMNPPATRALIMISIWCFCRTWLLYIPALNIVFLTAAVLLLKNPYYLKDMGFLFSFTVVGFLIAAAENINYLARLCGEKMLWTPPVCRNRLETVKCAWQKKLFIALTGCVVAWLASSGICLYYQGIYFPLAIIANFLLIPLVWVLFNLVFFKLILSLLFFGGPLLAAMFDLFLDVINNIIVCSYDLFESTGAVRPPLWSLFCFYILLAALVSARKKKFFLSALCGVAICILFWNLQALFLPPSVTVLRGGESPVPAIVICVPENGSALVVNVPSFEIAQCINSILADNGIRRIDRLIFTGNRRDCVAGIKYLVSKTAADSIIQLQPQNRSKVFAALLAEATHGNDFRSGVSGKNSIAVYQDAVTKIIGENPDLSIEYIAPQFNIKIAVKRDESGVDCFSVKAADGPPVDFVIERSNILEMREYVFKQ
ncbi:MAG: ComEC/Rec2 family competence protein [Victivallaceae bacterium]